MPYEGVMSPRMLIGLRDFVSRTQTLNSI